MRPLSSRGVVLGAVAAVAVLLAAAPTPARALSQLQQAPSASDVTVPLVALLSLLAWALAAWLLLTFVLTAAAHLPGVLGASAAGASRRVAPVAVRRAIEVGLGLTMAVGAFGAGPAAAEPGPPAAASAPGAVSLDWAAPAAGPDLDWAAAPAPAAPVPAAPDSSTRDVVVSPGDSLWELAEQDLATRSGTAPTDADVAKAWPAWWAANRDAVGPDPHLLHPGIHLTPPAVAGGTSPASS